jgi:hypothetical protein
MDIAVIHRHIASFHAGKFRRKVNVSTAICKMIFITGDEKKKTEFERLRSTWLFRMLLIPTVVEESWFVVV